MQLAQGTQTDINIHILARAIITFIPIFMYFVLDLSKQCKLSKLILKIFVHYIFSLGAAFLTVYILGFQYVLSKNAYHDIFINFSAVYQIVAIVFIVVLANREKKQIRAGSKKTEGIK